MLKVHQWHKIIEIDRLFEMHALLHWQHAPLNNTTIFFLLFTKKNLTIKDRDAWERILGVSKSWECSWAVDIHEPRSHVFLVKSLIVNRFDGSTVNKPTNTKIFCKIFYKNFSLTFDKIFCCLWNIFPSRSIIG